MLWLFTVKSIKGHAHLASCVQSHPLPACAARFHNKADKNSPEGEADPHDAHFLGTKMKRPVHPCLSNEKPRDRSARTTMCADTSTWDLSQDFEFGVDFYFGDDQVPQVADKTTVHERQKELNRTAQQRTRQKKKVREVSHFQPGDLTRLSLNVACLFHAWCLLCTMIRSARQTLRLSLLRQPASCTTLG